MNQALPQNLEVASLKEAVVNIWDDLNQEKSKLETLIAKSNAIIASIGDGIIVTDTVGNVVLVNQAATRLLGIEQQAILGHNWFSIVQMEDERGKSVSPEERPTYTALQNQQPISDNGYYFTRQGSHKFPVAITTAPVTLNHEVIGTVLVFRDITKEKQIEQAKSEFVALASHQLRTPISTINWYLESLSAATAPSATAKSQAYLAEAYRASQRMASLVNTLLAVSQIEVGNYNQHPSSQNIVTILEQCLKNLQPDIVRKHLRIHAVCPPTIPFIQVDDKTLGIALENILSNAIKYSSEGTTIELSITIKPSELILSISDSGYGIPNNQQSKVFSKMFRADNARAKEPDGNGLGLYITKSIIEQCDGKVWFNSVEDKGTTFYVSFPLPNP